MRSKLSSNYLIVIFIIFELLMYLIEPYITTSYKIILNVMIVLIVFGCLIYFKKNKNYNKNIIIYSILGIGFLFRIIYIMATSISVRQHDVGEVDGFGHLQYIYDLFKTGRLPDNNWGQFYHPPLFHILGSIWLKINSILGIGLERSLEGLQYLTLMFSTLTMVIISKITDKLNIKFIYKVLINMFIAVYPTFIILSGSINNDCLLVLLEFSVIYYLIKWNEEESFKNTIILALLTGFCVMTKLNGAIMAIPIIYVFIRKFIKILKEDKSKWKSFIVKIFLFGLISLPIGLWFQIRAIILFGSNKVPIPGEFLYTGNYSLVDRFLSIDFKSLSKIFCVIPGDYNIFAYLVKCSIFGEFTYGNVNIIDISMLIINFILIIISIILTIKYVVNRKEHSFILTLLVINYFTNIISFIGFNLKYPYLCTMDYRYIVPTMFTGLILVIYNIKQNNSIFKRIIFCIIVAFIYLCCLWINRIT